MEVIRNRVFCRVNDELSSVKRLNQIAEEYERYGYTVQRGRNHSVFVFFPNQQIEFYPLEQCIMERIFR